MTLNSTLGFISTIALFLPPFFILVLKLGTYRTFPALLIYFSMVLMFNVFKNGYIPADETFMQQWGLVNNVIDIPLILTFLTYFSTSAVFTRRMKMLILGFAVFETVVLAVLGLTKPAITIILGPGLAIVIALSLTFFIRQTKITIAHHKATGKALIAAGVLFAYGCYGILYLLYYLFKTNHIDDTFLIYFFVATISSGIITAGIIIEHKRIRRLAELRITRRELSDIYSAEKQTVPVRRKAMLDFDRDQWN